MQLTHNEDIKEAIPTLAGSIASTLANGATDQFSGDDNQFLKFHGVYQQDDRDLRSAGKKFIMNWAEGRGIGDLSIFFAESRDLINWHRLGLQYEFHLDTRWYEPNGRWVAVAGESRGTPSGYVVPRKPRISKCPVRVRPDLS